MPQGRTNKSGVDWHDAAQRNAYARRRWRLHRRPLDVSAEMAGPPSRDPHCPLHLGVRMVRERLDRPRFISRPCGDSREARHYFAGRKRIILRCPVMNADGRRCPRVAALPGDTCIGCGADDHE